MDRGATVLLVDENDDFLDALGAWLEAEIPGLHVAAHAHSVHEALDLVARLQPDLVVSDLALPDGHGFRVGLRLAASGSSAALVLLTADEGRAVEAAARAAGAHGCVSKMAVARNLVPVVRAVLEARGAAAGDGAAAEGRGGPGAA